MPYAPFDTCFHEDNDHLPDFGKEHKAYHAQYVGVEPDPTRVEGLYDFVTNYMKQEDILPTNPLLWQLVTNTWIVRKTLPLYQVSLEVMRKSFMQHTDVMKFHEAVAIKEPYGIFEHGWSDHVLRFIDTAMFVSNENFMTTEFQGFGNRERCAAVSSSLEQKKEEIVVPEQEEFEEITIQGEQEAESEGEEIIETEETNEIQESNGEEEISKEEEVNEVQES
jgi:hypothetical protein